MSNKGYEVGPDGVAICRIAGGGSLNIINSALARELSATFLAIAVDPAVRALIITGSGSKTFVGGADIREMATLDPAGARRFITDLHEMCEAVRNVPVPTLASIHGWCIGVGLELAASCDLRICAANANFTMPEVRIGIPSVIHGAFLSRLVGEGRARWLMLTGRVIDAATALQWGLVTEIVEPADLDRAAAELVGELAGFGEVGMRAQKQVLRTSEAPYLDAAMLHSIDLFSQPYETDEPAQYMQAFLQRKKEGKA